MTRRRALSLIAVAVIAAGAAGGLRLLGIGTGLELESVDARFRLRGPMQPPSGVVLVQVDEKTLSDLRRRWPFPRAVQARLIDRLAAARPRAIAIDLQYTEPTTVDDDNALIEAIQRAGHVVLAGYIDTQKGRNEFLKRENAKLDKEIEAVKRLKDDIQALLARKQVIEALQTDRSRSVELLDQVARQTPEGIYLKSLKQEGLKVTVVGYAQSNARVSTLMRNLQSTGVFDQPTLLEIKAAVVDKKRL